MILYSWLYMKNINNDKKRISCKSKSERHKALFGVRPVLKQLLVQCRTKDISQYWLF